MIRVTVELIPFGDESKKETLETLCIVNVGKSRVLYDPWRVYEVYRNADPRTTGTEPIAWCEHRRTDNVWKLVRASIESLGGVVTIILDRYPFPPQSNNIYTNLRFRTKGGRMCVGRRKSAEYLKYEDDVRVWAIQHGGVLRCIRDEFIPLLMAQHGRCMIRIDTLYCVPAGDMWTKAKTLKRWDAMNRLKAQYDTLAKLIGVDDFHFYPGVSEKVVLELADGEKKCVTMKLTIHPIRTRTMATAEFLAGS